MIKIILSCFIVVFFTFCGYLCSQKYRRKRRFYQQFVDFNESYLNEMRYNKRPIQEFVVWRMYKTDFAYLLKEYMRRLCYGIEIYGFVFALNELDFLTRDEKTEIDDYFQMLGKGDSRSQIAFFSAETERLKGRKTVAEETYRRYGDLSLKLGFLCGIFIIILLI